MVCADGPGRGRHRRGLFGTLVHLINRLRAAAPTRAHRGSAATAASPFNGARAIPAPAEALEGRTLLSSYFVATNGSDSNPGTLDNPFRTIQRAANVAQPGDSVLVRQGTYRETVKPARSGTSSGRITFKPYNGETVTVSGADPVGGWSRHSGDVFKARLPWDLGFGRNQVFVDGRMMIEARWPNTSISNISRPTKATADSISGSSSSATLSDSALGSGWEGATIHIMPGQGWVGQTGRVTSSSAGKLTYSYTRMNSYAVPTGGDPYYLTGKFKALDAPGEWYFEDSSDSLFLRTPNDADPQGHVEAKRRQFAFDLKDRKYIDVDGFDIFAAAIVSNPRSGNLRLRNLDARYLSQFVTMSNGWDRPHDTGLYVDGSNNLVENCTVTYSAGHGIVLAGSNSRAENNVVRGFAYNGADDGGIRTAGSGHVVTRNTVYDGGRSGLKISNTSNIKVTHNLIHDVMLQTTDGGGIYTYGEKGGGEIAYNRVYDVITGGYGGVGIFLDNYSQRYVVHHNVVSNANHAMKMNLPSRDNKVYNNTLDGRDSSISSNKSNGDMSGSAFYNNIFTKGTRIGAGTSVANNLVAGTDPQFVSRSGGNYQLRSSSPAINKGRTISPYTNGSVGAPDQGAFEYGKSRFSYGASQGASAQPEPEPTPPPAPAPRRNAREAIQAESFDGMKGVVTGPVVVGHLDSGDWLKYEGVDFGLEGVEAFIAVIGVADNYAGRRIEVRTGSPTGPLAGSLTIGGTGGWGSYQTQSVRINRLTGVKDLYLVIKGGGGAGNLESFRFA